MIYSQLQNLEGRLAPPPAHMRWQTIGFALTALYNWSILVFSKGLTNTVLFEIDTLFTRDGCICVLLWGAAYAAMATTFDSAPYVVLVFAFEKVFYYQHWHAFAASPAARIACNKCQFTKAFYKLYGLGDLVSGSFFFYVAGYWMVLKHTQDDELAVTVGAAGAASGLVLPVLAVLVYLRSTRQLQKGGAKPPLLNESNVAL